MGSRTAMSSVDSRSRIERRERRGDINRDENEMEKGPRLPGNARERKGGKWAAVACFSAKQGLGIS